MDLISPTIKSWIQQGKEDPEGFWEKAALQLPWFKPWDKVFESDYPSFRWFIGAETNLGFNAVDYHVNNGHGDRKALIYFNERGDRRVYTYSQLLAEVVKTSAALRGCGINKGDRITLCMPTCAEAIILMLAIVRIGAIHSVVFAGFGARALSDRIGASGSKLVFTADVTYRKGGYFRIKDIVDESLLSGCETVEKVIVLDRLGDDANLREGRDMNWQSFLDGGAGHSGEHVAMEANESAFILATSGTTAAAKLVIHSHGGYQVHVHAMARWCYDLKPTDIWWATSDIGWIVGHSYIVYGPLLIGCTTVVFEGVLDYPEVDSNWRIPIEEFGVTGIFTSPTAVRMFMKYGDDSLSGVDHSKIQRIFCAGEVLNAPAWDWLQNKVLKNRIPVIDHMWQTETSGPIFCNPYGIDLLPIKPGSATIPMPGIDAQVVDLKGKPCKVGEKGIMVLNKPFPGLTAKLWGDSGRYAKDYWEKIEGVYYSGDSAHFDEDGYVWFGGRADEVIKIAAHRLSTIEVETACLTHPAVAECGVTGRPDEARGEVISAFVLLKQGYAQSDELRKEIIAVVRKELGPIAVIGEMNFVSMLPKTRSGKIMRRVLKAVTLNIDPGDITTIEEEGSVEDARQAWQQLKRSPPE